MTDLNLTSSAPDFSAIITSYFEERSIEEFYSRLSDTLRETGRTFEIIMIDDGSTDGTFDKMKGIFEQDMNVSAVIRFFKNAGQLAAMTAGICQAQGQAVIFIDSDLQLAPEELPRLIEKYDTGFDLVSGFRVDRKDSLSRILPSKIANVIMRKASGANLSDFGCTFKIYNAKILRAFDLGPHHLFDTATVISTIGRYCEVPISHYPRRYGKSGWTFKKLWKFNTGNIMHLSERPFQILAALSGFLAFLVTFRVAVELVLPFKLLEEVTSGLLLNALLLSTLAIVSILCLIGEFVIRAYGKLRRSPSYIIRDILVRPQQQRGRSPGPERSLP